MFSRLLHSPFLYYSVTRSKPSRHIDNIFKDYYSRRLTLQPHEYEHFLKKIASQSGHFKEQDHRWHSLTQNIQLRLGKYTDLGKVYMLKALVDMDSRVGLSKALLQDLEGRVNALKLEESVLFMWCVAKISKKGKTQLVIQLFQRIIAIIGTEEESPPLILGKSQGEEDLEVNNTTITATTLAMLLSTMSTLSIIDKPLVKKLTKEVILPNLATFQVNTLIIFLTSFQRLGLKGRRAFFELYKSIRIRYKELQTSPVESLINLSGCISSLAQRNLSQNEKRKMQKYEDERPKKDAERADMQTFFLWVLETILLRESRLTCCRYSLLLLYSSKLNVFDEVIWRKLTANIVKDIMEANITDLTMAVKAIALLNRDKRESVREEEDKILKRLWQLESSITGQSLTILAELTKKKRIRPPPKLAKQFQQHLVVQQAKRMAKERQAEQATK